MYTELFNPIYATRDGLPVIVVGVKSAYQRVGEVAVEDQVEALVIDDDGRFSTASFDELVADVRHRDGEWHDVSPKSDAQD
jgi:hypothetical protein